MMDKLWEALNKLAESMGVAVEHLYVILVQQAKVQMVWDVLIILGIVIAIVFGIVMTRYFVKKCKADGGLYNEWDIAVTISGVITGAFSLVMITTVLPTIIKEIVQIAVNPPVWILEYVMNLIK